MAQFTYGELQNSQESNSNAPTTGRVGYFSLPNNGDTAIVRIMHDSPDTFEIVSVHSTYVDGKFRKINCLRNYGDPVDRCPLCVKDAANNAYPSKRIYIHMIQYVKDDSGSIVAQPVIWDRPARRYCDKLINLMQEYGNLSDMIIKIKRNGAAGDTNTDYDFLPANQQVYPSNIYVKDTSLFDGYSVLQGAVLNKDYDDLAYFAQYESFPEASGEGTTTSDGWNGVPSNADEGIPFDSPQADAISKEIVSGFNANGIPQWNVNPVPQPKPQPAPQGNVNNTARPTPAAYQNFQQPQMQRPTR